MIGKNLKTVAFALLLSVCVALPVLGEELFMASKKGYRYHYPPCSRVKTIKPANLIKFKNPADAKKMGYVPCNLCNPPKAGAESAPVAKKAASEERVHKAEALCAEGKALALEKKCTEALPYFDKAVREDPGHVDAYFQSGVCKSEAGRRKEAIEAFQKVIALDPSHGQAYYSLGVLYATLRLNGKAIAAYRKAIELKPDDGSAYYNLGVVYATLERYEDAAAAFKEAARIRPDLSPAFNNLGVCLSNLKQYAEAAGSFREALRLKPDDTFASYNLGVISIGLGDYTEAVQSLSLVKQAKPGDETTRYHLGVAYARSGDRKSSEEEYRFLLARKSPLAEKLREELHKEESLN